MGKERQIGVGTPYFDEDADSLDVRIKLLSEAHLTSAKNPRSTISLMISNIRGNKSGPNEYQVNSRFLLTRVRPAIPEPYNLAGRREDVLRVTDNGLKLASRTVYLTQSIIKSPNLSFFLQESSIQISEQFHSAEIESWVNVEEATASRKIFSDEAIFQLEIERIFGNAWLYIGHESEIPAVEDFVTRLMGKDPVILVRVTENEIAVLLNSCLTAAPCCVRPTRATAKDLFAPTTAGFSIAVGALGAHRFPVLFTKTKCPPKNWVWYRWPASIPGPDWYSAASTPMPRLCLNPSARPAGISPSP